MSKNQIIISIGREFGCGGFEIASALAEHYNFPLYDRNILKQIAFERGVESDVLAYYDEKPKYRVLSRTVRGYSNSPQENIAKLQFDFLRERAELGESFIALGRCSEAVLKGNEHLIAIFLLADLDFKIDRVSQRDGVSKTEAENRVYQKNRKRKSYHDYYCPGKWGDSRNYDLTMNTGRLGIEKTTELLIKYIDERAR